MNETVYFDEDLRHFLVHTVNSVRASRARKLGLIGIVVVSLASFIPVTAGAIPTIYTVTFFENDNGSDNTSTYQIGSSPQALNSFAEQVFSNPGHTFVRWNTAADGSGTSYVDGATYSFASSMVLYAQWTATFSVNTVTFFENDGTSDTNSTFQTGSAAQDLTSLADLGFSNPGHEFEGWNTASNGTGTFYADSANFSFASGLILYAQWTPLPTVTATFNDNGGIGSVTPIDVPSGTSINLPSSASLTRTDFALSGWNTVADGSGVEYSPGASMPLGANTLFFAQWTETSPLAVTFAGNGGIGSDPAVSGELGSTVTLPGVSGLTYAGYTLTSWNSAANGSGTSYALGQSVTLTSPLVLYAQWTAAATSISVSFSANGGSGSLSELSGVAGASVTLPGSSSVVRSGFTLTSWNTAASGAGTSYSPGQSLTLTSTLTLYAQWKKVPTSVLYGAIATFSARSTGLTSALQAQVRRLATAIKTRKYTKVSLFGFTAATGISSLDHSISAARASNVANLLRSDLRTMRVKDVDVTVSGVGSVDGRSNSKYSRVEVFVS
jgi:outer membrane protein OmpA-like peptidoglycan-associated protein